MKIRHQNSRKMNLTENRLPVEMESLFNLDENEIDLHRYFDCPYYQECLCYACNQPWESFTCTYCPHYIQPQDRKKKITINNIKYTPFIDCLKSCINLSERKTSE
jgi:hypothetical protein